MLLSEKWSVAMVGRNTALQAHAPGLQHAGCSVELVCEESRWGQLLIA